MEDAAASDPAIACDAPGGTSAAKQSASSPLRDALRGAGERAGQAVEQRSETPFAYRCPGCGAVKLVPLQTRSGLKDKCIACLCQLCPAWPTPWIDML